MSNTDDEKAVAALSLAWHLARGLKNFLARTGYTMPESGRKASVLLSICCINEAHGQQIHTWELKTNQ
jgi:hypothetical protein